VVVSELKGRAAEAYPINRLRNLAILKVVTSHLLLTDIDLWPSSTAYAAIIRTKLLRRARAALVLPAFEFHEDKAKVRSKDSRSNQELAEMLPGTQRDLRKCTRRTTQPNCQVFKGGTDTHTTTNYDHWWRSTAPSKIPCFQSLRYEPYLVVRKQGAPPFDERFVGYGKNKIQWIQHLRLLGFSFHVMPRVFVVHCPHEDSNARRSWEAFRDKKDRLFNEFVRGVTQARNATISTKMCKTGVNWGVLHPGGKDPGAKEGAKDGAKVVPPKGSKRANGSEPEPLESDGQPRDIDGPLIGSSDIVL